MKKGGGRLLLAALLLFGSSPALSEEVKAPPAYVALTTTAGEIVVEVDRQDAPLTSANFLSYVDKKLFDGTSFYRALRLNPEGLGLIQGGTRGDPKRALPPVAHEPTSKTGLSHVEGAISMARGAPGTATGDFFIITGGPLTALDAQPASAGDKTTDRAGYAVFGKVVKGMDVVEKILTSPVSATTGEGVMKGQMLEKPVTIERARRTPPPAS